MKCESCGCPYITNVPDGDVRFEEPFELVKLRQQLASKDALLRKGVKIVNALHHLVAGKANNIDSQLDNLLDETVAFLNRPEIQALEKEQGR